MPGMKSMLGIAVGICGAAFVGYCIYFDNKRRSDPNFRKRLRERRKAAKEEAAAAVCSQIPPLKDSDAVHKFFLQEIQLGEELLSKGDINNGVEHLVNAIIVCGQPRSLLSVLNTTLPPQVFQLLMQQLSNVKAQLSTSSGQPCSMVEEDVE